MFSGILDIFCVNYGHSVRQDRWSEGGAGTQSDWPGRLPGAIEGRNEVSASQPGRLRYYGREPIIRPVIPGRRAWRISRKPRSEEHTSELQSLRHLVCRL